MFTLYVLGDKFITINKKTLKVGTTKSIEKAAVWSSEAKAKGWNRYITNKFPAVEMRKATLTLVKSDYRHC